MSTALLDTATGLVPGSLSEAQAVAALAAAALVQAERQGRHLVYRPLIAQMNELIAYLTDHCCGGQPCGLVTLSPSTCC